MPKKVTAVLSVAFLSATCLTACGGGNEQEAGNKITVWTEENLEDRMAVQEQIIEEFTRRTGIQVELVGIAEDQFSQVITTAAAAGDLPDVIGALPLASVRELEANDLLDTETPGKIVDQLGRDTFSARALEAAAAELNTGGVAGITLAVAPKDSFTAQSFEHVALANGCELVDDAGNVTLGSPQCVQAFAFYTNLARKYSVKGSQDVDSTRATYFAGKAAMTIWSSFILDELAGLRNDALPSCEQCRGNPQWLAENTGVVTALKGPAGSAPAQYGEIVSWAIMRDSATDPSARFVSYMMNEGYERWLGMAPEGKFPTRTNFAEKWEALEAGVDTKKPLGDIYPPEVLDALRTAPDTFDRWGIPQGQGKLAGAVMGELPVPTALSAAVAGSITPQQAAAQATREVETIKRGIRE